VSPRGEPAATAKTGSVSGVGGFLSRGADLWMKTRRILLGIPAASRIAIERFAQLWRRPSRRPFLVAAGLVPATFILVFGFSAGRYHSAEALTEEDLENPRPISAAHRPPPISAAHRPPPVSAAHRPPPAFSLPGQRPQDPEEFRRRNLFGIRLNNDDKQRPAAVIATPPPSLPPVSPEPSTKLELTGTYVSEGARYAIIREKVSKKEDVYGIGGSPLPNWRITQIEPREVRMTIDGAEAAPLRIDYREWKIAAGPGLPQPASEAPSSPGEPTFPAGSVVDSTPRKLARQEVDSYLDNLNTLLTQVNIQPVFQGGQPSGFRLTDIQKGTILDQIGVQDGDVLRFVNGQRIDSVQSAFQLYNILKESTNIEITVLRNTRPTTLRYVIY